MVPTAWALVLYAAALAAAEQQPYILPQKVPTETPLSGRFLHITDMHMDRHYRADSAVVASCHHDKPHYKHGGAFRAGHWGTPVSDCDSPRRLGNATLDWITRSWRAPSADEDAVGQPNQPFDFVLWTGDSARHDQDAYIPRDQREVLQANEYAAGIMESHFPSIPIVPNFGNNDVALHNTMPRGPSPELDDFLRVWKRHIPADQTAAFRQGGFFAKDIVPGKLGAISLNTLYFYDSNKAVDGCPRRHRHDRRKDVDIGTLQLEWMTERLLEFRRRNMQVHIIGHVPPTGGNYFDRCFDVYTELVIRFQDTIVGQHYGHMNLDMFFIQESSQAATASSAGAEQLPPPVVMKHVETDLRHDYASLPGSARTHMDYYSLFYVSPSVIPTYMPSVRVWTYNTSLAHDNRPGLLAADEADRAALLSFVSYDSCEQADTDPACVEERVHIEKKVRHHRRPKRKSHRRHRKLPRYASPQSPSRTNTFLSPLGYSQWVVNLTAANDLYDQVRRTNGTAAADTLTLTYDLEYATYPASTLWHAYFDTASDPTRKGHRHHTPMQHHIPVPRPLLDKALAKLGIDTPLKCRGDRCHVRRRVSHLSEYSLKDMTLRPVMDLARRLVLDSTLWKHYVHRMYTNSLLHT